MPPALFDFYWVYTGNMALCWGTIVGCAPLIFLLHALFDYHQALLHCSASAFTGESGARSPEAAAAATAAAGSE